MAVHSTQKSRSEVWESSDSSQLSSEADQLVIAGPGKNVRGKASKEKRPVNVKRELGVQDSRKIRSAKTKKAASKMDFVSSPLEMDDTQELPDFTPALAGRAEIAEGLQREARSRIKSVEKQVRADASIRAASERIKTSPILRKTFEIESIERESFPSCMQFTILRLLAFVLLLGAWIIVLTFPCLRFTYRLPVFFEGEFQSITEVVPLKETCKVMPRWWAEPKSYVKRIIQTTGYFRALNSAKNNTLLKRFELFDDEETVQLLKPYNGQMFVIFGCVIVAFPILISLMFMRCFSQGEDLMEEAMFDLVEISIFCVFTVAEFYMASGAEIRAVMDVLCGRFIDGGNKINGLLKEKLYNICNDVEIEAYGFIASGAIFLFLILLFVIDLIILLKNAEELESKKYLQMATCLHYGKPLENMPDLVDVTIDASVN